MNGFSTRFETGLQQRVDPRVVLSSRILQLAQNELEQAIETELWENPALERLEEEHSPLEESTILESVAPYQLKPSSEDHEFRRSTGADEEFDWTDFAASHSTLWEHLQGQLSAMLPHRLHHVALHTVDCVDERGYFTSTVEDVALATGCSLEEAEVVFQALRKCEPLGVGATSIEDCLLIQLRDSDTLERKLARAIIRNHMEDFVAKRFNRISRKYRVLPDVVERACAEILALDPYPAEAFRSSSMTHVTKAAAAIPDLCFSRTDAGWLIEVKGPEPTSFHINRTYSERLAKLNEMERAPKDEKRHLGHYVDRANNFISCLQQRRRTLSRIGAYLAEHQAGFLSTGNYQFLQPLTRAQLATDVGLHESTVSRATMDKFVQLPNGEVVSFEIFFKPALRVQKMIEEILQMENPQNPLSDDRIAQMLADRGVTVARRTVNKYRDRRKLLSSRKRRSA